ncbi:polysaccharide deacetylase family protein [Candidatus Pelagibacter sp. HIMB1321]|uniref:polysaccharide deacetylase family protein n=1 Tax=Candidatus Pelagibacter sp. HIMB1321 TaxID=1388755 RepID=UPI001E53EF49|nr:polysaccharide deacetylase family protein [Candidatus Pelagibacter sp. HIMB1321]
MSDKHIFLFAASIIKLFIILFLLITNSKAEDNNIKQYSNDEGVLSIMYHRFDENKYPSTNIQMEVFLKQIQLIKDLNYSFIHPEDFEKNFNIPKKQKKILITVDDAFQSFYEVAWPFLKENRIPFILFVSTEPVGNRGYMTWEQIREVEKEKFAVIGHHSHSHKYLIDKTNEDFEEDIETANRIFNEKIGYVPSLFSYPFGEYSEFMRNYISKKFTYAFGQHSGVIDVNKEKFQLPRFPINENYGELKRFTSIIKTYPLEYKELLPVEKKLNKSNNPPSFSVEFFKDQKNIKNINCYSNEGNQWEKSNIIFNDTILNINFREAFLPRRGRINCSLNDDGKWRWFGTQFIVKDD